MAASLIYRNVAVYETLMLGLYGRHYLTRQRAIADLIPAGASVLELCCGPGFLYRRFLRAKHVRYEGLDINPKFVSHVSRHGGRARVFDLRSNEPLPAADHVIMQASLYQFLPDPEPIVERMLRAARIQVIIAEPVRNLACSRFPAFARLARRHTDPGSGLQMDRFSEKSLDEFFRKYASCICRAFLIPGGREKVYVLGADDCAKSVGARSSHDDSL